MRHFKFDFEYVMRTGGDTVIPHNSMEEAEQELREMYNDVEDFKILTAEEIVEDVT